MTNKSGRKRQRTNNLGHELIRGLTQVTKGWCIIAPLERTVTDIFKEKRKCCNHRCPDSVYLHPLLLITLYIFECYRNTYLS